MKVGWRDAVIIASLAADAIEISSESSAISFQYPPPHHWAVTVN